VSFHDWASARLERNYARNQMSERYRERRERTRTARMLRQGCDTGIWRRRAHPSAHRTRHDPRRGLEHPADPLLQRGHITGRIPTNDGPDDSSLLLNVMSRRHSSVDLAEPGWRHAGRECHDGKSFGEGCCSGSRRIPRRGAAVLRKAMRSKYTPFRQARFVHAARFQRDPLSCSATIRAMHDDAEAARFDAFILSTDQHARAR